MNRRAFLRPSGLVAFGSSVPCLSSFASASSGPELFRWSTNDLVFPFEVKDRRLRQKRLVQAGAAPGVNTSSGVEVALQCAALVDRWIETRLATGAAPATINRSTQVFGQAFKLAVEHGQLSSAPKLRHLPERNARTGFFAAWEVRTVMENVPAYLHDFALFGFLCGWRSGEIKSLVWEDVDGDCIRLRGENSKNGESRVIVL